jgi:ketosteroid isomerase-like protein
MQRIFLCLACLWLMPLTAWGQSPQDIAKAMNEQWIRLHDASDVAGLTDLYAVDAILCPPQTSAPIIGHDLIRAFFERMLHHPGKALAIQLTEARQLSDSMIIQTGTWQEKIDSGPQGGLYVGVLTKQGERWKFTADTWNINP